MPTQTHRQHREEQTKLLEENAALKARIAAEAARVAMGALPGEGGGRPGSKTFAAVGESLGVGGALDTWLARLERYNLLLAALYLLPPEACQKLFYALAA